MNRVLGLMLALSVSPLPTMAHEMDKGMDMSMPTPSPSTTPAAPTVASSVSDYAADKVYDPASMARARAVLHEEHGGELHSKVMLNLFEYQTGPGADAYRWDGDAWFGSDINRLVLKSEGEGSVHQGVETAELQALYSRAVDPYTDLQIGIRQDIDPQSRAHLCGFRREHPPPLLGRDRRRIFYRDDGRCAGPLDGNLRLPSYRTPVATSTRRAQFFGQRSTGEDNWRRSIDGRTWFAPALRAYPRVRALYRRYPRSKNWPNSDVCARRRE